MSKSKSKLYLMRRRAQQLVYKITSPEIMSKIYFRIVLGKKLNLTEPRSFNEKIQWLKLNYYPNSQLVINGADKYRVREYLIDKGYKEHLARLINVWDDVGDIDWGELPSQFVIKCNHGCGYNIICDNKEKFDVNFAKKALKKWINEDFATYNAEPHYSKIARKIICEEFLGENIINYNIFCCNGKASFISVIEGLARGNNETLTYYYSDGTRAEFYSRAYPINDKPLPEVSDRMKEIAEDIAKDFPFVRIDFYYIDGKIYFSELTFTPGGAMIPFAPPETDMKLGQMLDISKYM